jgi:CRP/FNR family transcriptional regulator
MGQLSRQPDAMPTMLDALRDASSQFTRLERHGRGAVLFLADDPATALYRVVTGCVKLLRSMPDGRCQILRFCGPGQVFGWTGNPSHSYAAEAVNDVSLECIDAAHLNRLAEQDPQVQRDLMFLVVQEIRASQTHMLILGRMSAEEKLQTFLTNYPAEASGEIHLPMSRAELADHLGLTSETVSRTFSRLRRGGLLSMKSVTDPS